LLLVAIIAKSNFPDADLFCVKEDYDFSENDDDDGASILGTGPADTAE